MSIRSTLVESGYARLVRPLLFRAHGGDPEKIHEDLIAMLSLVGSTPGLRDAVRALTSEPCDPVEVAGITFPGRVGLAAGMDKDGHAVRAWKHLGFAFAELGTVTAQAQPGNPKPRIFRLKDSRAIINRMGFNNDGALALANRLAVAGIRRGNGAAGIPLGISIGKTKVVPVDDAVQDYVTSLRHLAAHADYVAVNVSSPNTPNLRTLQDGGALTTLLTALSTEAKALAHDLSPVPVFVKLAPDLTNGQIDEVLTAAADAGVAGVIATNTTLSREGISLTDQSQAHQTGGLSGAPLTLRSREVVSYITAHTDLPVMGVGGVMTADDALALLDAGASLIQIYTGFIYSGPALIGAINKRLSGR